MTTRTPSAYVLPTMETVVAWTDDVSTTNNHPGSLDTASKTEPFHDLTSSMNKKRGSIGLGKPPSQCSLSWSNISYTVTRGDRKTCILTNVTGRCASGELTAVMGPSGCGKTTLLDILADRVSTGTISGVVELNGQKRNLQHFRGVARYVAQEDCLLGCFTVQETLCMAAHLTLPRETTSTQAAHSRVDRVVTEMGLQSCEHAYIGDVFRKGISGGQKRRLSIAMELLSNPSILLLDEPTTGLDSAATFQLMKLLTRLCQQDRTVLCTIHQPSSLVYDTFTSVLILAQGQTVYCGPRQSMLLHFETHGYKCPVYANPCEYCIGLVNADFDGHGDIDKLITGYATGETAQQLANQIISDRTQLTLTLAEQQRGGGAAGSFMYTSCWQQFVVLLHRNLVKNIRNPGIYAMRLFMYSVLAVCVGTMYLQSNHHISANDLVVLLFGAHAFFMLNSVAVVPFFIQERAVFVRERGNSGLHLSSFVLANFIAGLPGILAISLSASVIIVSLSGLHNFGWYLLIMFLSLVTSESLMHVLGAVANDGIIGLALGASLFGMFMLCEGFMVPKEAIPGYWLWVHYAGFPTYGFQAFIYNQFYNQKTTGGMIPPAVARLGLSDVDPGVNMAILVGYTIGLELVFTAILYKFHTGRR